MLFQSCEVIFKADMSAHELLSQSAHLIFHCPFSLWENQEGGKKKKKKKKISLFHRSWKPTILTITWQMSRSNANSIAGICGGVQPGLVCGGNPGQLNNIGFPGPPPTSKGLGLSSRPCITAQPCWWPRGTTLDRSHPGAAWEILITWEQQTEIWRPWVVQVHV